jgi:hypothetical protein
MIIMTFSCPKQQHLAEEATRVWRKMYNKELHNLYLSPNIICVIKSSRMGGEGM